MNGSPGDRGTRVISTALGRQPHPLLGAIWCAADLGDSLSLPSRSALTLLERRLEGCLVDVVITTGRPHQIRIHTAGIGALLLGDLLYRSGGAAGCRRPGCMSIVSACSLRLESQ